jgi:hypothetical protein
METAALIFIALCLAGFFVMFTIAFAVAWREIAKLLALIALWRQGRRFFKSIERFRRDFSR